MAAEQGRAFLVKIGDGAIPEVFTTIGGMRSTSLSINSEAVDVTNKASGGWRELLGGAGLKSVSVTGAGVFTNSAAEQTLQQKVLGGTVNSYEIIFESGNKFTGSFQATRLDFTGDYNGERNYSLTLVSSGAVTFVTA